MNTKNNIEDMILGAFQSAPQTPIDHDACDAIFESDALNENKYIVLRDIENISFPIYSFFDFFPISYNDIGIVSSPNGKLFMLSPNGCFSLSACGIDCNIIEIIFDSLGEFNSTSANAIEAGNQIGYSSFVKIAFIQQHGSEISYLDGLWVFWNLMSAVNLFNKSIYKVFFRYLYQESGYTSLAKLINIYHSLTDTNSLKEIAKDVFVLFQLHLESNNIPISNTTVREQIYSIGLADYPPTRIPYTKLREYLLSNQQREYFFHIDHGEFNYFLCLFNTSSYKFDLIDIQYEPQLFEDLSTNLNYRAIINGTYYDGKDGNKTPILSTPEDSLPSRSFILTPEQIELIKNVKGGENFQLHMGKRIFSAANSYRPRIIPDNFWGATTRVIKKNDSEDNTTIDTYSFGLDSTGNYFINSGGINKQENEIVFGSESYEIIIENNVYKAREKIESTGHIGGFPSLGIITFQEVDYLFFLIRPHGNDTPIYQNLSWYDIKKFVNSIIDDGIYFLQVYKDLINDYYVRFALKTDGSDSAGLIYNNILIEDPNDGKSKKMTSCIGIKLK